MTDQEILGNLTEVFRDVFNDASITITSATSAADIAAWDSVNNISLMVAIEMRLGLRFKTSELEELRNVGDLVSLIEKKLASKST